MNLVAGDKIEIQNKWDNQWYAAVVTGTGYDTSGYKYIQYDLTPPIVVGLWSWKDGIHKEDIDPNWEKIRLIELVPRKKKYRLLYDEKNACYRTEQIEEEFINVDVDRSGI